MAKMMTSLSHDTVLQSLKSVNDPDSGQDIVSLGMIGGLQITPDGNVIFMIEVDPRKGPKLEPLRQEAERAVEKIPGVNKVTAVLTAENQNRDQNRAAEQPTEKDNILPGVKNIIAITSGKGGVGKSTVAVNIAASLADNGQKIGLLDADIYGPSLPRMTGLSDQKPGQDEQGMVIPLKAYGMKIMSIGFMIPEDEPLIWRGPKVQSALLQLLRDVDWGELDTLIIDMPPGTGDAQLTLAQKVPVTGAIIVSTPQDIALIDARKAIGMFEKVDVPILGIIENMSYYKCPSCGHEDHIFGHGGARDEAKKLGHNFLGEIPLHADIRKNSDKGTPIVIAHPDSQHAQAFREIAAQIGNNDKIKE